MNYKLNGTIKVIEDEQQFDSGFTKREFVVTTEGDYPQDVKFELIKDKTSVLDNYKVGQDVEVDFNLKGNEWNGKYFVNLQAWKLTSQGGSSTQASPKAGGEVDDLPY